MPIDTQLYRSFRDQVRLAKGTTLAQTLQPGYDDSTLSTDCIYSN